MTRRHRTAQRQGEKTCSTLHVLRVFEFCVAVVTTSQCLFYLLELAVDNLVDPDLGLDQVPIRFKPQVVQ